MTMYRPINWKDTKIPDMLRRWRIARDKINKMGDEKRSKIIPKIEKLIEEEENNNA